MTAGERIAAAIQQQGRRKGWVAEQMGISASYLTRLLNGSRPWPPHLRDAAARVLDVPEDDLFFQPDCRRADSNSTLTTTDQETPHVN